MGLFGKRTSEKQVREAERQARLEQIRRERVERAYTHMQTQLLRIERKKDEAVQTAAYAQGHGLSEQLTMAKNMIKRNMLLEKRIRGMIVQLDLMQNSRDIAGIQRDFFACMNDLSKDIIGEYSMPKYKQAKRSAQKNMMRAKYVEQRESEHLDRMLSEGDAILSADAEALHREYDAEVDRLIDQAVGKTQQPTEDAPIFAEGVRSTLKDGNGKSNIRKRIGE